MPELHAARAAVLTPAHTQLTLLCKRGLWSPRGRTRMRRGLGGQGGQWGVPGQLPIKEQLRASPESCVVVSDDPLGFK